MVVHLSAIAIGLLSIIIMVSAGKDKSPNIIIISPPAPDYPPPPPPPPPMMPPPPPPPQMVMQMPMGMQMQMPSYGDLFARASNQQHHQQFLQFSPGRLPQFIHEGGGHGDLAMAASNNPEMLGSPSLALPPFALPSMMPNYVLLP